MNTNKNYTKLAHMHSTINHEVLLYGIKDSLMIPCWMFAGFLYVKEKEYDTLY